MSLTERLQAWLACGPGKDDTTWLRPDEAKETIAALSAPSAIRPTAALLLAQIALRRWTDLYAHLQNESGVSVSRRLDYNLPPAEHVKALEAIEEALAPLRGPLGMRVCAPECHSAAVCLHPDNCKADMSWVKK